MPFQSDHARSTFEYNWSLGLVRGAHQTFVSACAGAFAIASRYGCNSTAPACVPLSVLLVNVVLATFSTCLSSVRRSDDSHSRLVPSDRKRRGWPRHRCAHAGPFARVIRP